MSTIYVNQNATGNSDGSSWDNAFTDLEEAIALASPNDEIWVAEGTYKSSSSAFKIPSAVGIYGGFAGGETSLEQRNWTENVTILSGDIGQEGVRTDNTRSVVDITSTTVTTVLDGFTVSDSRDRAGIISGGDGNAILRNLIIRDNNSTLSGGGFHAFSGNPTFSNVAFIDNFSQRGGGAIHGGLGTITVEDGLFLGNEAQTGGAIYGNVNVTNGTFYQQFSF